MGCFLVMTDRDLRQLSGTLKEAVGVVGGEMGGGVRIKVGDVEEHNAREMAARIRAAANSARVVRDDGRAATPMKERLHRQLAEIATVHPRLFDLTLSALKAESDKEARAFGKVGERIAAEMLQKTGYLDDGASYTITKGKGIDITGRNRAGHDIVVEVKTSSTSLKDSPLGARMKKGVYKIVAPEGLRQMDDDWLRHVAKGVDVSKAHVLCVFIDTNTGVATLWRRGADATQWKPLMTRHVPTMKLPSAA